MFSFCLLDGSITDISLSILLFLSIFKKYIDKYLSTRKTLHEMTQCIPTHYRPSKTSSHWHNRSVNQTNKTTEYKALIQEKIQGL